MWLNIYGCQVVLKKVNLVVKTLKMHFYGYHDFQQKKGVCKHLLHSVCTDNWLTHKYFFKNRSQG